MSSLPVKGFLRLDEVLHLALQSDLREEADVKDRKTLTRAIDELQAAMLVVPSEVHYLPKFTYIWTLAIGRFPDELRRRVSRSVALREVARCFLSGAGITVPRELARVTGLSRPDAGLGNRALVAEGFASSPDRGVYVLASPRTTPVSSPIVLPANPAAARLSDPRTRRGGLARGTPRGPSRAAWPRQPRTRGDRTSPLRESSPSSPGR
jgi:hypothetical protein